MPDSSHYQGDVRTYARDDITVTYDVQRCIHAAECVHGLPAVFDPDRRPWIDPEQAPADAIADVIHRCPTGALQYRRADGASEPVPSTNEVVVALDGPLYVHGDVELRGPNGDVLLRDTRVALCRCGASKAKPFCDGSHTEAGFADEGELGEDVLKASADADGPLRITLYTDGPLGIEGAVTVRSGDGTCQHEGAKGALCRCGASGNKPYCDGTHARIGFSSANE